MTSEMRCWLCADLETSPCGVECGADFDNAGTIEAVTAIADFMDEHFPPPPEISGEYPRQRWQRSAKGNWVWWRAGQAITVFPSRYGSGWVFYGPHGIGPGYPDDISARIAAEAAWR